MTKYTCKDCEYYFLEKEYCTNFFYKTFSPDSPICDNEWFKKGVFNKRFYVLAKPLIISTGYYYVLVDRENELTDNEGDYLSFSYSGEAEIFCIFLNKYFKYKKRE